MLLIVICDEWVQYATWFPWSPETVANAQYPQCLALYLQRVPTSLVACLVQYSNTWLGNPAL